ncbi:LysR family transcriptional regulator [Pseudomonas sp. LA21]|uniref:helix-turn-helix domain-containing protein n=1 Tax=Pseudomonas sp. LA21 TaxID=2893373 RepID=UPI001FB69364|nr:LysR family transcriptional regulator [Pseudomonas sp. LA21]MCJ1887464.1 LysR family transcriptional regulator [Pseudomonas sp. LA21]
MSPELEHFSKIDFNLFVVFMAVYEERGFTRAAKRLNVGQPAISNSIAKLRKILGDRLFIANSRSFRATPRATLLAAVIGPFLSRLYLATLYPPVPQGQSADS